MDEPLSPTEEISINQILSEIDAIMDRAHARQSWCARIHGKVCVFCEYLWRGFANKSKTTIAAPNLWASSGKNHGL